MPTVVLDNEAVQALRDRAHPKHQRALSYVQVIAGRKRRTGKAQPVLVPTAVRVEAGWDKTDPEAAFINLLGVRDAVLDDDAANRAARLVADHQVSVADSHIGAVVQALPTGAGPVTIISSDPKDMAKVANAAAVTVVYL